MTNYSKVSSRLTQFKDRLARDKSGAALVEYTVLIGLITVATVATIGLVGDRILALWQSLQTAIGA